MTPVPVFLCHGPDILQPPVASCGTAPLDNGNVSRRCHRKGGDGYEIKVERDARQRLNHAEMQFSDGKLVLDARTEDPMPSKLVAYIGM